MRGASALERVLKEERSNEIRAFVIWEPVLWTDFAPPSTRRLASISDARVAQYWDPNHFVSDMVTSSAWAAQEGIFTQGEKVGAKVVAWDLILLFPRGSCAGGGLPEPMFHGNPVVTRLDEARDRLRALVR
ncbi:MAG: hypothetical protein A2V77_16600 [Anaeromyxobacter sp. RBG_16_69_14]|nr:MAG: hypothetical protein A2V77_16600 [Anaeromyxobacter sp. RBG_16_69_14]